MARENVLTDRLIRLRARKILKEGKAYKIQFLENALQKPEDMSTEEFRRMMARALDVERITNRLTLYKGIKGRKKKIEQVCFRLKYAQCLRYRIEEFEKGSWLTANQIMHCLYPMGIEGLMAKADMECYAELNDMIAIDMFNDVLKRAVMLQISRIGDESRAKETKRKHLVNDNGRVRITDWKEETIIKNVMLVIRTDRNNIMGASKYALAVRLINDRLGDGIEYLCQSTHYEWGDRFYNRERYSDDKHVQKKINENLNGVVLEIIRDWLDNYKEKELCMSVYRIWSVKQVY